MTKSIVVVFRKGTTLGLLYPWSLGFGFFYSVKYNDVIELDTGNSTVFTYRTKLDKKQLSPGHANAPSSSFNITSIGQLFICRGRLSH